MILLLILMMLSTAAFAQELELAARPEVIHIESIGGNIVPMERIFFHVILHNVSGAPLEVDWVRFDIVNSQGVVFSGQYSGNALIDLFDSAVDRRRIEPTAKDSLVLQPDERKAISDIFMDFPTGFIGDALLLQAQYKSAGNVAFQKLSTQLIRVRGFSGRLPFDGVWYVANEHGFLDSHKRFLAEAFAYDFLQIGADGRSFQGEGARNEDYFAYGKGVLAAKDGTVVFVRSDIIDNVPAQNTNLNTPTGNVVIIDHGNGQFGFYGRLRPNSITVRVGSQVRAGDVIAQVGNSGDSWEPHLHFHVMNSADPGQADGIPLVFENWKSQAYSRAPMDHPQGIPARGEFIRP
jgi:hypothetical protein